MIRADRVHVRPFPHDPAGLAMVVRLPGDRVAITGTPVEVGQLLAGLAQSGRLASATMPAPTGIPGQVLVNCRLVTVLRPSRPAVRPVTRIPAAVWCVGGVVTATAVTAVWATVAWLIDHWAILAGGAAVLIAAVLTLARSAGVCAGLHCPGCGHR